MCKNMSEIERGIGHLQGLLTSIMDLAREKAVPFEAIYRLGSTARGRTTLSRIVEMAHADWLAEQPQQPTMPSDHYRIRVAHAPLPSLEALKDEFGENNVSSIFDGRPFELHSSCTDMDRTPGDRIFYTHRVGRNWRREELIAWGLEQRSAVAPNGYRPAIPEEMYEFYKAHLELVSYVALGSSTLFGAHASCAVLWRGGDQLLFGRRWIDDEFSVNCLVLFVSK